MFDGHLLTIYFVGVVQMENSGVVHMLRNTKTAELCCMYRLLGRVAGGLRAVSEAVSAHLRERGRALVQDHQEAINAITYVQVTPTPINNSLN